MWGMQLTWSHVDLKHKIFDEKLTLQNETYFYNLL